MKKFAFARYRFARLFTYGAIAKCCGREVLRRRLVGGCLGTTPESLPAVMSIARPCKVGQREFFQGTCQFRIAIALRA